MHISKETLTPTAQAATAHGPRLRPPGRDPLRRRHRRRFRGQRPGRLSGRHPKLGTRGGGYPASVDFLSTGSRVNLEQKIADVGILHALTQTAGAVSLHIPWDTPTDYAAVRELARDNGLIFDAINSNTFQDQPGARQSYKHGSLSATDEAARKQGHRAQPGSD